MINPEHLRLHVIRPTLGYLDPVIPYSMAAENLLMGTCATESGMGRYLMQLSDGPACGIYQMEGKTEIDVIENFIRFRADLAKRVGDLTIRVRGILLNDLIGNLFYATAMARVHYWRVAEPLPAHDDVIEMAHYWKAYFNTMKGKGTVEQFIDNYRRYVK